MKKELTLQLDTEVVDWLLAQPEQGAVWLTQQVRAQIKARPPEPELSGDALRALALTESMAPELRQRVVALIRYPQLVDAVARGYVSVERAEEMAEEADSRAR